MAKKQNAGAEFDALAGKLVQVPKKELNKEVRQWKKRRKARRKKQ